MREPGFYWVLHIVGNDSEWIVARYMNGIWSADCRGLSFNTISESMILQIDERRIVRDEHPGFIEVSKGKFVKIDDVTLENAVFGLQRMLNEYFERRK